MKRERSDTAGLVRGRCAVTAGRFTHVDDMRPDVAARARLLGWRWRLDMPGGGGGWGKTRREAMHRYYACAARNAATNARCAGHEKMAEHHDRVARAHEARCAS